MALKVFSGNAKVELDMAIRNRQDISKMLQGYTIQGLNLSGAIITEMNVSEQDISNVNLAYAIIGTKDNLINWNRIIAYNCNFMGMQFPGAVNARRSTFSCCNFTGAFLPFVNYSFSSFKNCTWCDTVFTIGPNYSIGAVFDDSFLGQMAKFWNVKIVPKNYEEVQQLQSMEELNGRKIES